MDTNLLVMLGRLAGLAGILFCVVAGIARLLGNFYLAGFAVSTLLQVGMAGLLIGSFVLLVALNQRD
jgi:hypothetical protein